jgi:hypothetical protein
MKRPILIINLILFAGSTFAQILISPTQTHFAQFISGSENIQSGEAVYVNTLLTGYYLPAGAGVAVADDLHLSKGGKITGFSFAYYDSGPFGQVDASLSFFSSAGGPALASFGYAGLMTDSKTAFVVTTDLTGTGYEFNSGQDLVMQVSFSRGTAGWLAAGQPQIGSSLDGFWLGQGGRYWFGGQPAGSFYATVAAVPEPQTAAALAGGLAALVGFARRKR